MISESRGTEATVFVVDDDPGALNSMRWLLEAEGFAVETYSSGVQFLNSYDPQRPGCLLLDLRMPEMDGLQLQERLSQQGVHPPIVFVTGHGDVPKCARAMKSGAIDFLEKPASERLILDSVSRAIERDRRRRSLESAQPEIAQRIKQLTPRERQTMQFMLNGDCMKKIAGCLGISIQTVAKHRKKVLEKMQVRNEAELVRLLIRHPVCP